MPKTNTEEGVIEQKMYGGKVLVRFLGPTEEKPGRHIYMVDGIRKTGVTTILGIKDKSVPLVSWATGLSADYLEDLIKKGKVVTLDDVYVSEGLYSVRKQEAADIGTKIHDWAEKYIKHKLKIKGYAFPEMPDEKEVQIGINAFLDWEKEHEVKFISSERVVYSKKYDYIGKMDVEAKVDGKVCLIDLKSSNGIYNAVRMQTAAYAKADEEEQKKKIYSGRWAIRLSKETEKDYNSRMDKKNQKRVRLGKDPISYPPYAVFEVKYLDDNKGMLEDDFEAFTATYTLFDWDKRTDFFRNQN